MPPLSRLRRSPWLAGALLLVLAAGFAAPVAWLIGARHWSLYAGLLAIVLLLLRRRREALAVRSGLLAATLGPPQARGGPQPLRASSRAASRQGQRPRS